MRVGEAGETPAVPGGDQAAHETSALSGSSCTGLSIETDVVVMFDFAAGGQLVEGDWAAG
jgi:hypothetical protein